MWVFSTLLVHVLKLRTNHHKHKMKKIASYDTTFVSMSRSMRSFTVHPAPLRSKDPQPNSNIILKSGKCPGIAAKLIDLNRTNYT